VLCQASDQWTYRTSQGGCFSARCGHRFGKRLNRGIARPSTPSVAPRLKKSLFIHDIGYMFRPVHTIAYTHQAQSSLWCCLEERSKPLHFDRSITTEVHMKKLSALIAATLFAGVAFAQAPAVVAEPATKGDVKAAAKVEKAEIKATEKINKAVADQAVTDTKADAKAAKTKADAQAKADKKILAAKKDVAEAQVDAGNKVHKEHK
jgi:hypothetical protein